ncbi:MAG: asparagine synthase (glutamine-hydrolyzing) [Deltaproteobacteria bacterium]|nr:asparagine synthase (glutamine-hydrolyzing) [Deltaproteobacteria bacterium]
MCGIAGIYNQSGVTTGQALIAGMASALAHRGPDDEGFHLARRVHLASRRLRIIDLEAGAQPIFNADKTLCIVFNGEIYNYLRLRSELEKEGYPFQTRTDTEVVLAAYAVWGKKFLDRLRGMFAFCIWNAATKELLLARDRFGMKPLYVAELFEGTVVFASEIKALLKHPYLGRRLYAPAVNNLLTYGFNLAPHTFFDGVKQVLPGHYVTFTPRGRTDVCYWDVDLVSPEVRADEHELAEMFREHFTRAVSESLVADVPVAAYLSGGIDSSAVVGVYSQLAEQRVKTMTITFDDAGYDERAYSRQVSSRFRTENSEFPCAINQDDIFKLMYYLENPLVSLLNLPLYLLSAKTREAGIKVVLAGDGADEILGGYDYFKILKTMAFIEKTGSPVRQQLLRRLYPELNGAAACEARFVQLRNASAGFPNVHPALPYRFHEYRLKGQLFAPEFSRRLQAQPADDPFYFDPQKMAHRSLFDQSLYLDIKMRLLNLTLPLSDKMSMANSVEVRPLFLDHDLVNFCFRIPAAAKMRGLSEKHILKKSMQGLLPPEICGRKKQPLQPPGNWFIGVAGDMLRDYLTPARVKECGYFNPDFVAYLLHEYDQGSAVDYSGIIVVMFFMQLWHDMFLD